MSFRQVLMMILLGGCLRASAQGGFIVHFNDLQAGRSGAGISVREVPDGYLAFCHQYSHDGTGKLHVFTRRLDQEGTVQGELEYTYGDNRHYDIGYIDALADGNDGSFLASVPEGWGYGDTTFIYRFDASGNRIFRLPFLVYPAEDSVNRAIRQSRATMDDGYVLGGFWQQPGDVQAFLIRLNAQCDTLWTRRIGLASQNEVILGLDQYTDGGFVLTGYRQATSIFNSSFLIRTDANGNPIWTRYYGGYATQNGSVKVTADGGIVTWSNYREPSWPSEYSQVMLTKWNAVGDIVWQKESHYGFNVGARDFEVLPDGSFIGVAFSAAAGLNGMLCKFSPQGDSLWTRGYQVAHGPHYLNDVTLTSDGGFVCTGEANRMMPIDAPNFQQSQTIYVVKTDSLGCVVPGCHTVGVQEYALDMNQYLSIAPNPVAAGQPLRIRFEPPPTFTPNGPLRVVLLDATGRRVHEEQMRGTTCNLAASNLATGLHYLHLTDGTRWLAGAKVVVE
jgi:hypothetical protein